MAAYPYRLLFAWSAVLLVAWVALCSPWSVAWNVLCGAGVVAVAGVAIWLATRRARIQREAGRQILGALDAALQLLPADLKHHTPLILVVGHTAPILAEVFGEALLRITDTAIWVRIDAPERLIYQAHALQRWRDGQGPDALAYLLAADQADSEASLAAGLKRWRPAIGAAYRAIGYALPVCVAVYLEEPERDAGPCPWFGISGSTPLQPEKIPTPVAQQLASHLHATLPAHRQIWAHRSAQLAALTRWTCAAVLPAFVEIPPECPPLRLTAFGVTVIPGRPAPASLYGQFVTQHTGLTLLATGQTRLGYPLPEALLRGIPPQTIRRALPSALAHATVCLALVFCAAAAASAWQNYALVDRVSQDTRRYQALTPTRDAARVDALKTLKTDRDELERYARFGVPPRLGFGFYRGAALLPVVRRLIADYQPPSLPPSTIELDSLALFKSNSAVLNPGSNRVLVAALEMIQAHPGKRVLVAGHTDSVGNPQRNLELSEARAASVRDWLADASGIPVTHFAIQGYGDTRPKAANDSAAGRAANRRVEISLVPDCRDTLAPPHAQRSSLGLSACSSQ